MNAAPHVLLLH